MTINTKKSFTEYSVDTPTGDFQIGFSDFEGSSIYDSEEPKDIINVTVDNIPAEEQGYNVLRKNSLTIALEPLVQVGTVRLQRETNIDTPFYKFTAGALFEARTVDENFLQVIHSQQEVRDGFNKLYNEVTPVLSGLEEALQKAEDASKAAQEAAEAAEEAATLSRSASNVIDSSGLTQQDLNALFKQSKGYTVATAAHLKTLDVPKDTYAQTLGYHKVGYGSGYYAFKEGVYTDVGSFVKSDVMDGSWELIPYMDTVTLEQFGAYGDGVTNDSIAAIRAFNWAKVFNLPVKGLSTKGYLISSVVDVYTDTYISKVVFPTTGGLGAFNIPQTAVDTEISVSTLNGLTVGSSVVTGLPLSAVGRYVVITSTDDILTERYNPPTNVPYYKNTAFKLLSSDGSINTKLDMSFNKTAGTKVVIRGFEKRLKFHIGSITATGAGTTVNSNIAVRRDSVDIQLDSVDSVIQFQTLIHVLSNDCTVKGMLRETEYTGLGYGVSIGTSCDTSLYNVGGTKGRATLDGRHGSNVTSYNCTYDRAGTHWGNNYIFYDCKIHTIAYSGYDLTMKGGILFNAVSSRGDIWFTSGTLLLDGVTVHGVRIVSATSGITNNFYTSLRKFWSAIILRDITCTTSSGLTCILAGAVSLGTVPKYIPPNYIELSRIRALNSPAVVLSAIALDEAAALPDYSQYVVDGVVSRYPVTITGRGFNSPISTPAYNINISGVDRIVLQCDSNYFRGGTITGGTLNAFYRINTKPRNYSTPFILNGVTLQHDASIRPVCLNVEYSWGFNNCDFGGNVGIVGEVRYAVNCGALIGATNHPPEYLNYRNPIYYKQVSGG